MMKSLLVLCLTVLSTVRGGEASLASRQTQEVCSNDAAYEFEVWGTNDSKIMVGCDWITDFNVETRRSNWCNRQTSEIIDHCAVACGTCGCQDNPYFKFEVLAEGGGTLDADCAWLTEAGISDTQVTNRFNRWCANTSSNVSTYCPVSCKSDQCEGAADADAEPDNSLSATPCEDNPDYIFNVLTNQGGGTKAVGCDWIKENGITTQQVINRNTRWCVSSSVTFDNCPVSCDAPCSTDNNRDVPDFDSSVGGKNNSSGSKSPSPSLSPSPTKVSKSKKSKSPSLSPSPTKVSKSNKSKSPSLSPSPTKVSKSNKSKSPSLSPSPTKVSKSKKKQCKKPKGSQTIELDVTFSAEPGLTVEDLNLCSDLEGGSGRRRLQEPSILSAKTVSVDLNECEGEDCSYDAKFDVYYEDDSDSSERDIIRSFNNFFEEETVDIVILETTTTTTLLSKSTNADITTVEEGSNLFVILPIGCVCIVAFALTFFVVRRRRSVRSSLDHEEASLVSRSSVVGDETIVFPVSSNGLNNEFEVDGIHRTVQL